jgi:uncharacterized caspase-like protein
MARNWAICIGVNQYDNLPELRYAQRDAELMRDYFLNEVGFKKVYLFTDNSPPIEDAGKPFSSKPTYGTLKRFFRTRFDRSFLSAGDNLWFFFSGHGLRHADRDYLMPSDADPHPDGVEETAIALNWVTERLRRCGADNVVLLLDACRNEGSKGLGVGEETQNGVITIASCSPAERSYEIDEIGQGAFTFALLESLRIQGEGNCATVERLNQRLRYRVEEINRQFRKPRQTPYTIAEPASKYHLILLPKYATLNDIAAVKNDAYRAEVQRDWELAKQLWIRVNIAAAGSDLDAIEAIQRFPSWCGQPVPPPPQPPKPTGSRTGTLVPTPEPPPKPQLEEVQLLSDKGADYSRLRDLLAAGKWEEADEETAKMMLQVAGREAEGYLREEDIDRFPCADLRTIDRLWVKHSNGHFGFSVQKEIYQSLGGTREYNSEIWEAFGEAVGWCVEGDWLYYDNLTWDLVTSKRGHLPLRGLFDDFLDGWCGGLRFGFVVVLLSRRDL